MRFFRPSLIIYVILSMLFTVAVVVTIDKFNGIKDQYASMEPNLDNYSTAEILFLAFERTRTAAYDEDNPDNFSIKKSIFDSKVHILKNKSININSFYYEEDFLAKLNKLETQSEELSRIYEKNTPYKNRKEEILKKMDSIQPTLIDLQEIIYRIQIRNFNKIKSIIQDNSSYTEATALASICLLFLLMLLLWKHISKLKASLREKNIFISAIYHELSGSIQKIQMSREMIDLRGDILSAEKYLANITYHSNKLFHQTKEILEFSKIEIGNTEIKKTIFALSEIIEDIEHLFNIKNHNELIVKTSKSDVCIKSDKQKISSIIHNLVDNANKNTYRGKINLTLRLTNNNLFIKVSDTGCGFDIKKLNRLYEPFNQGMQSETKQGLGLGLTIIKSHLKTLNAKIKVRSTLEVGSVFFVYIPLVNNKKG